tara:strand:+ start:230 stop:439 length:210 start_codon:yes stop_codon:yes gene_type:complete
MTNNPLERLRKKLSFLLDNLKIKFRMLIKSKQNNKIIINKDIKNNIPKHLKGLNNKQLKDLESLFKMRI